MMLKEINTSTSRIIENTKLIKETIEKCLNDDIDSAFKQDLETSLNEQYINLDLIKKIKYYWNSDINRKKLYIHELIKGNNLYLPQYKAPERDPKFQKHLETIKAQLDEEAYQNMVYNVNLNSQLRQGQAKNFSPNISAECIINIIDLFNNILLLSYLIH
jgi:hypothetical protein